MADEAFLPSQRIKEDFKVENEFFGGEEDSCCFLPSVALWDEIGSFEVTIPTYAPNEFRSYFRMTKGAGEILWREIINTGRIRYSLDRETGRQF